VIAPRPPSVVGFRRRSRYAAVVRWAFVVSWMAAACAHPARPTVSGAELYAQVHALQRTGQATIRSISVRKDQVLASGEQAFMVAQVIDKCRGGDPAADVDCTLTLVLDQRFTVMDHLPQRRAVEARPDDQSRSIVASVVVVGLAAAAIGGLGYGAATCDFPGCKAVFGVPLVLIGGSLLFLLGRD